MAALVGLDAKLYYGTAGSTPSTELTNVRDVTFGDTRSEANLNRRASWFNVIKTTRRGIEINWTMINDDADTGLAAIIVAYVANTALAFKIVDKTAGTGVDADFYITKCERSEPDETEQTYAITIKPTYITRWPAAA